MKRHAIGPRIARRALRFCRETAGTLQRFDDMRWTRFVESEAPIATPETYRELARQARARPFPKVDDFEAKRGFAIDQDWLHEVALHTQVICKKDEICYQHGRILYATLREFVARSGVKFVNIAETGTARGFSSLCMARALDDAGVSGRIVTFDLLPHRVPMYWNCIDDADGRRTRQELLEPWSDLADRYCVYVQGDSRSIFHKVNQSRVHFAFLDGMHEYENVMQEFLTIKDLQQPGDVIVYDDYTPSIFPGIARAVDEICSQYGYAKEHFEAMEHREYVIATRS